MTRKPAKDDEKILILKVTASDWEGRVRGMPYRVIAIPEKMSLYDLAEIIIESFGFDFDQSGSRHGIVLWHSLIQFIEYLKKLSCGISTAFFIS
ncbi:MAG: hypothetical protein PWQ70_3333 [Clostridiales bacterium]|nr:hypothetical protein [Clostridiales bacterium]